MHLIGDSFSVGIMPIALCETTYPHFHGHTPVELIAASSLLQLSLQATPPCLHPPRRVSFPLLPPSPWFFGAPGQLQHAWVVRPANADFLASRMIGFSPFSPSFQTRNPSPMTSFQTRNPSPMNGPFKKSLKRTRESASSQEAKKIKTAHLSSQIAAYNRRLILDPEVVAAILAQEFAEAQKFNDVVPKKFRGLWQISEASRCPENITSYENAQATIGMAGMQGRRKAMEDEMAEGRFSVKIKDEECVAEFIGLFDGHAGGECSQYLKAHTQEYLKNSLQEALSKAKSDEEDVAIFNVLKLAFVYLNEKYRTSCLELYGKFLQSGSAAIIALIINDDLWVANVGDSRAILVPEGNGEAVALSEDAKPELEKYRKGAEMRGGVVVPGKGGDVARVYGKEEEDGLQLSLARSVGRDEELSGINPRSKVIRYSLKNVAPGRYFMVMACDGMWDVVSTNLVAQTVKELAQQSCVDIATHLIKKAYVTGSSDNISACVVALNR